MACLTSRSRRCLTFCGVFVVVVLGLGLGLGLGLSQGDPSTEDGFSYYADNDDPQIMDAKSCSFYGTKDYTGSLQSIYAIECKDATYLFNKLNQLEYIQTKDQLFQLTYNDSSCKVFNVSQDSSQEILNFTLPAIAFPNITLQEDEDIPIESPFTGTLITLLDPLTKVPVPQAIVSLSYYDATKKVNRKVFLPNTGVGQYFIKLPQNAFSRRFLASSIAQEKKTQNLKNSIRKIFPVLQILLSLLNQNLKEILPANALATAKEAVDVGLNKVDQMNSTDSQDSRTYQDFSLTIAIPGEEVKTITGIQYPSSKILMQQEFNISSNQLFCDAKCYPTQPTYVTDTNIIYIGKGQTSFEFSYETYNTSDKIDVFYGSEILYSTRCGLEKNGSVLLDLNGKFASIKVVVSPNCAAENASDNSWDYAVHCTPSRLICGINECSCYESGYRSEQTKQREFDGCGWPSSAAFNNLDYLFGVGEKYRFTAACNNHDICYGTCRKNKAQCDTEFCRGLNSSCNLFTGNELVSCMEWASILCTYATNFGGTPFQNAQKEHCTCRSSDYVEPDITTYDLYSDNNDYQICNVSGVSVFGIKDYTGTIQNVYAMNYGENSILFNTNNQVEFIQTKDNLYQLTYNDTGCSVFLISENSSFQVTNFIYENISNPNITLDEDNTIPFESPLNGKLLNMEDSLTKSGVPLKAIVWANYYDASTQQNRRIILPGADTGSYLLKIPTNITANYTPAVLEKMNQNLKSSFKQFTIPLQQVVTLIGNNIGDFLGNDFTYFFKEGLSKANKYAGQINIQTKRTYQIDVNVELEISIPGEKSQQVNVIVDPNEDFFTLVEEPIDVNITQTFCDAITVAGNDIPSYTNIDLGSSETEISFYYETYSQQDQIDIFYEKQLIFTTGCVGASDTKILQINGNETRISIFVTPNCMGGSGTAWNYLVQCTENRLLCTSTSCSCHPSGSPQQIKAAESDGCGWGNQQTKSNYDFIFDLGEKYGFTSTCNTHDLCYSRCGNSKSSCDNAFCSGLKTDCLAFSGYEQSLCLSWADIYCNFITKIGTRLFKSAQNDHCSCN